MRYDKVIKEYRAEIQKYIKTIPNNIIKMRRADNNGKIAQGDTSNLIGKRAIADAHEKENGGNFYKALEETIYVA